MSPSAVPSTSTVCPRAKLVGDGHVDISGSHCNDGAVGKNDEPGLSELSADLIEASLEPSMSSACPASIDLRRPTAAPASPDIPTTDHLTSTRLPPSALTAPHPFFALTPHTLQTSPYPHPAHLTPLEPLTAPLRFMAQALTHFDAVTPHYATAPYATAFNWSTVVAVLRNLDPSFPRTSFFCIVFRSQLKAGARRVELEALDARAHAEAVASGGLLKYWFGRADADGRNLATCVWRERADAKRGGAGKGHAAAMSAVRGCYEEWGVERIRLVVEEGGRGWEMREWREQE